MTAGAVDCHVPLVSPTALQTALASGTTSIVGGGTGPATTVTPGPTELPMGRRYSMF